MIQPAAAVHPDGAILSGEACLRSARRRLCGRRRVGAAREAGVYSGPSPGPTFMAPRADLYLVDGSSQMYRAYHAIRGLTGPDGRSTNAVYGFVTMLRKLLADHAPEYIAAAFDLPGPTFRTELAADYKANRAPMPPDLAEQIPLVHEACEALGVPVLTHERFEADDIIGTLARQAADAGLTVAIVTGDKDFFQLVGERVLVFNPRDEGTWYDAEGVKARFGVASSQVVDVLALMGDAIDNVKGVPGIGEKGARDLIAAYGSLDALLEGLDSVPQRKYREALAAHAEAARRSRDLVRIRTDVPVSLDLEALRFRGASRERCYELFMRLGFRSLVAEYAPTAETVARAYRIVASRTELDELAAAVRRAGRAAIHVLTDAGGAREAKIAGRSDAVFVAHSAQRPQRLLDALADLGCRHNAVAVPVACLAQRHDLDETDMPVRLQRQAGQIDHLIVVQAADDDRVDLDRPQARRQRGAPPGQHVLQLPVAGQGAKALRAQRVQADVDPGAGQRFGKTGQQHAVAGHREIVQPGDGHQLRHQVDDPPPDQRFPAGQADVDQAHLDRHAHDAHDLFIAQDALVRDLGHAVVGHAIDTAQVAAVGDRNPQVVNGAIVRISVGHAATRQEGKRKPGPGWRTRRATGPPPSSWTRRPAPPGRR